MRVSSDMPDDVIVLHDALQKIRDTFGTPNDRITPSFREGQGVGLSLYLKNCGTALRFLQVHIAKCYPGEPITLTGDPRLMERDGKPTTQTTSALILHGEDIPVAENESPYITLSRRIKELYEKNSVICQPAGRSVLWVTPESGLSGVAGLLEPDWSSAAFWYEYVAIHGGELLLEGLKPDSLQGDRIVADLYAKYFGVQTTFTPEGALIRSVSPKDRLSTFDFEQRGLSTLSNAVSIDFSHCPDLYPAVALTCEKLSIELHATGIERLRYKESDRLEAVRLHEVRNDHRMAMALMAADFIDIQSIPADKHNELQTIIAKSYPEFVQQITTQLPIKHGNETATRRQRDGNDTVTVADGKPSTISHITPIRGVNDDNLGKKHALSKLIHAATSDYLWLHDNDIVLPSILQRSDLTEQAVLQCNGLRAADLIILPLTMVSEHARPSLLEKLQIAEYAAIQELTMRRAKRGHAVMCSGANLIVRREAWLACEPDLHPEIPSGDDMFLLEAMKKRGYKISVIDEPDFTAVVRPQTTWRAFFRQRMRWAGKAPKYTDPDILRCGAFVIAANMLQLLCPAIILIKFPIEYSLIKKREPRTSWYVALLLEILYPIYIFISLFGGLFKRDW